MRRIAFAALCLVGAGLMIGCNSTSTSNPPPPQRLYVSDDLLGHIFIYTLPASASSTPIATIANAGAGAMTFDAMGRLFVRHAATSVDVFTPPLTSSSTPAFSLTFGTTVRDVAFDAGGNLFAIESVCSCIEVMNAPITSSSTVAYSFPSGASTGPFGDGFDPSGNLFVAGGNVVEFSPPFSSGSTPHFTFGTIFTNRSANADSAGNIYISDGPADGKIDVYTPPFSNASTPSFAITASAGRIGYTAFDRAGRLYVPAIVDNKVYVFSPPFGGSSTASFSVPVTGAFAVAVGP
jgi:hypothetical protein